MSVDRGCEVPEVDCF